jgi:hypothetical protein
VFSQQTGPDPTAIDVHRPDTRFPLKVGTKSRCLCQAATTDQHLDVAAIGQKPGQPPAENAVPAEDQDFQGINLF